MRLLGLDDLDRLLGGCGVVLVGGLCLVAACIETTFDDGQFLCDPAAGQDSCPEGQVCAADGVCRQNASTGGTGAGAGGDGGSAASGDSGGSSGSGASGAGGESGGASNWWDPAWGHRLRVTFDNSGLTEPLTNFPVPIVLDSSTLSALGADGSGSDLRFLAGAPPAELSYELELRSPAGSNGVVAWVRLPQLAIAPADEHLWVYADNPGVEANEQPADVWRAPFRAVWHLNEQGAAARHDSTGAGNEGAAYACESYEDDLPASGLSLAGAQRFDGDDTADEDRIEVSSAGLEDIQAAITIEARARIDGTTWLNDFPHVLGAGEGSGRVWQLYWETPGWFGRLSFGGTEVTLGKSDVTPGAWVTLALVYDGTTVTLYLDGAPIDSAAVSSPGQRIDSIGTVPIFIGNNPHISPREFRGPIDEVRISSEARSAEWLAKQHAALSGSFAQLDEVEQR